MATVTGAAARSRDADALGQLAFHEDRDHAERVSVKVTSPRLLRPRASGSSSVSCPEIPDEVAVGRGDPIYNAHAYLTKVPVGAIIPFIKAFTMPGDVVLDMYGGSGMTGVAASICGRRAEVRDISILGRHIGTNYVNLVDQRAFRSAVEAVIDNARRRLGPVYDVRCGCGQVATLSRTVWSIVYRCPGCRGEVNYYEAFKAAGWRKGAMACPACGLGFVARAAERLCEVPVMDTVSCSCSPTLRDQPHSKPLVDVSLEGLRWPDLPIGEDRQMARVSALRKHGLLSTASFFSARNLAVLAALHEAIDAIRDEGLRCKLMFVFTAILTRASKRYQWHHRRPLNAANQNYYIAPVFYEWNVYDLFVRKARAALRSDNHIRALMRAERTVALGRCNYRVASADAIDLPDASVDYVFTDPPFGANIFYSDMNLFQEAWLGEQTDPSKEAVVDRAATGAALRTAERYEELITRSLCEAHRVLKPGGWLSLCFSSSHGAMWGLLQRAVTAAGFKLEAASILDKGQRSVKGLSSGFENVVTAALILSMRKVEDVPDGEAVDAPPGSLAQAVERVLRTDEAPTPSHVYLGVIREFLRRNWKVGDLDIAGIGKLLQERGYEVDPASGRLIKQTSCVVA